MVLFDRLQISDDGRLLYMDVHVNKADYFDNIYIDRVVIQTSDQVSETDPLSPGDDYIYSMKAEPGTKEMHLALNAITDFDLVYKSLSDKLLFVYVICTGAPDACTPCRLDEMTTLGVTFDESLLYQQVMQQTRQLSEDCEIPKGFIDLILLWNGFKAAIETEHYIPAIDFWKKIFDKRYNASIRGHKPCGCHG
jgi:hypothetical protein